MPFWRINNAAVLDTRTGVFWGYPWLNFCVLFTIFWRTEVSRNTQSNTQDKGLGESTGRGQSWKQFCCSSSHVLFYSRAAKTGSSCSFSTWCFPSIMEKGKLWLRRTLLTISTELDEMNHSNTWVKEFRKLKSRTETSLCQTHKFLSI